MPSGKDIHILQLADIHGAEFLIDEISEELNSADIVILSGDITHFGNKKNAENILRKITRYNPNVLAVSGNCDYPGVDEYLKENKYYLDHSLTSHSGLAWIGLGGSLPCPGGTPNEFTDSQAEEWFKSIQDKEILNNPFILVSHQPPINTLNDTLDTGAHVGSIAVRSFIEQAEPLLCLTGHIHEGIGVDQIRDCPIINPGPFRTGKYASIKIIGENSVNIDLKQITV